MTVEEARRYIDEAERLPIDQVDGERLAEANRALTVPFVQDAEYARRAEALVQRVVDRRTTIQEARASTPPEELQGSGSSAGETMGGQAARSRGGSAQLDRAFERRLREAAAGAGIPDAEVDQIIAQALVVAEQASQMGQGEMVNMESLLGQQLQQWEEEAARNAPRAIGPGSPQATLPQGFVAQPQVELDPADRARFGGRSTAGVEVEPRYFEGDEHVPASMSAEEITRIQQQLVEAGLLQPGAYWEGFWDDSTADAYRKVLGYSNQRGTDWTRTIEDMIDALPDSAEDQENAAAAAATFTEPAYRAPDYATLAQEVKAMFRGKLGRDPSDAELAEMAGALSGNWKAAHDAAVAAAKAEFEAGQITGDETEWVQSEDPGRMVEVPRDREAPGTFTQVDPSARFAELFEQRFESEIDRLGSLDEVRQNTQNVFASVRTMDSLVSGR